MCLLFRLFVLSILCFIISSVSYAETYSAVCKDINGSRTEYFNENPAGRENNKFIDSDDSVTGSIMKILWDNKSSEASFTVDDSSLDNLKNTHYAKLVRLYIDNQQISFVGILNSAPVMITIYPLTNTAIYSIHSNWGSFATGLRANMFHAKCNIKNL